MKTRQTKIRVGIAGYGIVGKRRRFWIDQNPFLQTVAVCDQNYPEPGVMPDGVRYYSNYKQLLKEPLDVIFVSLPNYLAADVTIACLESGLHVFCEKPPGRNLSDIKRVIEVEKKHPEKLLKYGFNHRYHDSVRKAIDLIGSGDYGKIINVRGMYGKSKIIPFSGGWRAEREYAGGGILLDQGIHMVDLIRLFLGDIVEVKSYVTNSYWRHNVEDNAFALMRDKQGRIAMFHSSATQWQHRFVLEINLTEGFLELRGILSGSKSYGEEQLIAGRRDESDVGTLQQETIKYLEDNSWRDEINEFADSIIYGKTVEYGNSAEALATMKIVYQIYYADPEWRETYNIEYPE
jgi:predicted dehydrogenase